MPEPLYMLDTGPAPPGVSELETSPGPEPVDQMLPAEPDSKQ